MSERRVENDLDKGYEPARVEPHWARWWEQQGFSRAEDVSEKPPFSMVLPPPNVTGSLHLGHALTATIEDVLARWKRMSGVNVCGMPGIDHAGIATQMVVERELQKNEGKSRHDLGREEFLKRVWQWKEQSGNRIAQQHRALGASLDWDRERFTMDEASSRAVREAFVRLYDDGLLYRAERLINWCVKDGTALSDLEVDHEEGVKGELYRFAYPLADGSGEIVVATTRPETMLGDTAVAVHPDDERYKAMIGKNVRHPITGREFPIIADSELVDPKFGTGAVKVTPSHSVEDFESGKRHHLQFINILNPDGTLNANAGPFQGQDRIRARGPLKDRLAELGLERGTEPHTMALGRCQRCGSIIEPFMSKQWFVRTGPLAQKVIAKVDDMRFVPENWRAEFLRWMNNIHDWCISRQLWWGHQIPAWYCEYGHVTVARERPTDCAECHSGRLTQDPDVLDTWFSSGLWPFSTFGWPQDTPALRTFYPNSVMETGFDILFFWVARMAMLGLHFMGELPFRTVFLHAMVRDEKGEKMSKTRGNVIDPLDLTARYGADALRFTLASMAGQGRDIKLSTERIAGHRAFANKIWNAARFVLMNAEGYDPQARSASVYDRWILSRFQRCADETRASLEQFQLSDAANGIYRFIWNELCDWAIELSKPALYGEKTPQERAGAQTALLTALEGALRLLHPFMPFVTEEIWQRLPNRSGRTIMLAPFPRPGSRDEEAEREMDAISRAIDGARSVRGEVNLPPNQKIPLVLFAKDRELFQRHERAFQHLANASEVTLRGFDEPRPRQAAVHVEPEVEVHLPLAGLIDFAAESARVEKAIARTEAEWQGRRKRLDNAGFAARAPREVVEKDRSRADELAGKREKLPHLPAGGARRGGPTEDKNPQQPKGDGSSGEQGSSSGTPGGQPKSQPPQQKSQPPQPKSQPPPQQKSQPPQPKSQPPPPRSQPPPAGGEGMGGGRETSGMPEVARDVEKMAERAVERVKSIARGLMEKLPADLPGMGNESQEEGARARAPKRAPARRAKPKKAKKAKKAKGGTKGRAKAARGAKKSARSAGSRKGKAGKGARAKSGAKRRPASRKGKK